MIPVNPDKATTWLGLLGGVLIAGGNSGFNLPHTKQELGGWCLGLLMVFFGYLTNKK